MIQITPKMIILTIFLTIVNMTIFTISHPVIAYYQNLPADDDEVVNNIKWHERMKQSWAFMYANLDEDILELGCGNMAVAHHLAKILPTTKVHSMVLTSKNLINIPKSVKTYHNKFPQTKKIPFTVICHYEAQDMFVKHLTHILQSTHTKNIILEVDYTVLKHVKPWLELYGFKKQRQYIYLSVWQKNAVA